MGNILKVVNPGYGVSDAFVDWPLLFTTKQEANESADACITSFHALLVGLLEEKIPLGSPLHSRLKKVLAEAEQQMHKHGLQFAAHRRRSLWDTLDEDWIEPYCNFPDTVDFWPSLPTRFHPWNEFIAKPDVSYRTMQNFTKDNNSPHLAFSVNYSQEDSAEEKSPSVTEGLPEHSDGFKGSLPKPCSFNSTSEYSFHPSFYNGDELSKIPSAFKTRNSIGDQNWCNIIGDCGDRNALLLTAKILKNSSHIGGLQNIFAINFTPSSGKMTCELLSKIISVSQSDYSKICVPCRLSSLILCGPADGPPSPLAIPNPWHCSVLKSEPFITKFTNVKMKDHEYTASIHSRISALQHFSTLSRFLVGDSLPLLPIVSGATLTQDSYPLSHSPNSVFSYQPPLSSSRLSCPVPILPKLQLLKLLLEPIAFFSACSRQETHKELCVSHAPVMLGKVLRLQDDVLSEVAAKALANLACSTTGSSAVIQSGAAELLQEALEQPSFAVQLAASRALLNTWNNSLNAQLLPTIQKFLNLGSLDLCNAYFYNDNNLDATSQMDPFIQFCSKPNIFKWYNFEFECNENPVSRFHLNYLNSFLTSGDWNAKSSSLSESNLCPCRKCERVTVRAIYSPNLSTFPLYDEGIYPVLSEAELDLLKKIKFDSDIPHPSVESLTESSNHGHCLENTMPANGAKTLVPRSPLEEPEVKRLSERPTEGAPRLVHMVLLHGILGGAAWTWRQRDEARAGTSDYSWCWPQDWLAVDMLRQTNTCVRIVAVNLHEPWHESSPRTLSSQALRLSGALVRAGVGRRPVLWLAHSRGGLLLKAIFENDGCGATENLSGRLDNSRRTDMIEETGGKEQNSALNSNESSSKIGKKLDVELKKSSEKLLRHVKDETEESILEVGEKAKVERTKDILFEFDDSTFVLNTTRKNKPQEFLAKEVPECQGNILSAKTLGVLFLSTPHGGAPWARYASWLHPDAPELRDLQHSDLQHSDLQHSDLQHSDLQHSDLQHSDLQHNDLQHSDLQHSDLQHSDLQHLHDSFIRCWQTRRFSVLSLVDTRPMPLLPGLSFVPVPRDSADAGVGETIAVDASHLDICKPLSRSCRVYAVVLDWCLRTVAGCV
ncbi:uncharacterized protein LOC108675485 [Hyalella azteca]|uniref:Protein SERAC1 n=1 Tax=Hyalella azteca TaxID=294128 RepID=A0A979FIW7_HYAAZ|nr:uncharacterized protein LOC108675485 [Hyalella azteca]